MKNLITPQYNFSLDYHFRFVSNGEQEKDFENVSIVASNLEEAEQKIMDKYNSPLCRIFKIELKSQTPTITKGMLFDLTSPNI